MYIPRTVEQQITKIPLHNSILLIVGPRRIGKTTLLQNIFLAHEGKYLLLDCKDSNTNKRLTSGSASDLSQLVGSIKLIILDDIQLLDKPFDHVSALLQTLPDIKLVATSTLAPILLGWSAKIHPKLSATVLTPLSLYELQQHYSLPVATESLETRLTHGSYPEVVTASSGHLSEFVFNISSSYLARDLESTQQIRNKARFERLLTTLALHLGEELSYSELARSLNMDKETVTRYISLLEQAMIVVALSPLKRNLKTELGKTHKVYFWDLGMRNALIRNFNPLDLRLDAQALWENFLLIERIKRNQRLGRRVKYFSWRTYARQHIHFVEDDGQSLSGYEFKYTPKRYKPPKPFLSTYKDSSIQVIDHANYLDFVL